MLGQTNYQTVARWSGIALLATIIFGMVGAFSIAQGIDVNLTANIAETAENMLDAESSLKAKAYLALLTFGLGMIFSVGCFLILRRFGVLLASWALVISIAASTVTLLGAVAAMNAVHIAGYADDLASVSRSDQLAFAALQATIDYTSFHLMLVLSSVGNAAFYLLFLRSGLIPKIIAGWGLFASCFVASAIVARDFIPAIGSDIITAAFMLSNLVALVTTGLYLAIVGLRELDAPAS